MAISKRDQIGVFVMVGLFFVFGLLLYFTTDRPTGNLRSLEDNVIVEQRIKNLKARENR